MLLKYFSILILLSINCVLHAQPSGSSLMPLVKSKTSINVVVRAPQGSNLQRTIKTHVNTLNQDDWNLFYHYIDTKPVLVAPNNDAVIFKNRFGETGWAVISPEGRLLASGNATPAFAEFEKIILTTDTTKPIPKLRQFLRQHPDNLDARSDLIKLLRANAYKRTKQQLGISQDSILDSNREKLSSTVIITSDFVSPDVSPYKQLQLDIETDLIIWGKYAQELSEAFRNETWKKLDLAQPATETLPLEVCSPLMKVTFIRLKPEIERAIEDLPNSFELWRLWLHFQACIDSENYKFNFFDNIEPPPIGSGIGWPPMGAVEPLVKTFYKQQNWNMIIQLTENSFETLKRDIEFELLVQKSAPDFKMAMYIAWEGKFMPMLEALIRLGKENEANDFVTLLSKKEDSRVYIKDAVQVARDAGAMNLVNTWLLLTGDVS